MQNLHMVHFSAERVHIAIIRSKGSVTYERATDLVHVLVGHPVPFYRSPERVSDLHKVAQVSRRVRARVWGSGLLASCVGLP